MERVSERLGSISPDEVRNQFIPVIPAIVNHVLTSEFEDGSYLARTPQGIAIVLKGEEGVIITTWINDELATRAQLDGWVRLGDVGSTSNGRVIVKTAKPCRVFLLRGN
jgi:hypothetical protein